MADATESRIYRDLDDQFFSHLGELSRFGIDTADIIIPSILELEMDLRSLEIPLPCDFNDPSERQLLEWPRAGLLLPGEFSEASGIDPREQFMKVTLQPERSPMLQRPERYRPSFPSSPYGLSRKSPTLGPNRAAPPTPPSAPPRPISYILGAVDGVPIHALADTGADGCFISSALVRELGLATTPADEEPIVLASGKTVRAVGRAQVDWVFEGESRVHRIFCHVLETLAQPLALGNAFLRVTKTLTDHKSRILRAASSVTKKLLRLHLLGGGTERVGGYLDNEAILALPDTGSEIMAVSTALALRRGWKIDARGGTRIEVQFADGSTAWTRGLVSGLEWDFGNGKGPVNCDFYVLDDLPVEVVLGCDFVLDLDLFSPMFEAFFVKSAREPAAAVFCGINQLPSYRGLLAKLFGCKQTKSPKDAVEDLNSPLAFTQAMVLCELERREQVDTAIGRVSNPARAAQLKDAEVKRRREWDVWKDRHRTALASQESQPSGRNCSSTSSGGGDSAGPVNPASIPLVSLGSSPS